MALVEWKQLEEKYVAVREKELNSKYLLLIVIAIIVFLICDTVISEFNILSISNGEAPLINESSGSLLLSFTLFFWFYFSLAVIQFILKYSFRLSMSLAIKSGAIGVIFMLVGVIPINILIESNLESRGYSYCAWYTGSSLRAPDVWLKNDDFCLQAGSVHIALVREYFESKYAKGQEPDLVEFKQMLAVANKKRDEEFNRY